jgi:hypothetical protein
MMDSGLVSLLSEYLPFTKNWQKHCGSFWLLKQSSWQQTTIPHRRIGSRAFTGTRFEAPEASSRR